MWYAISWSHYLATVIILTVFYYLYIVLRYYRAELAYRFNSKQQPADIFSGIQPRPLSVIGQAKPDDNVMLTDSSELRFASTNPADAGVLPVEKIDTANSCQIPAESSKEVIKKAADLMEAFKNTDDKSGFLALLNILIDSYQNFQEDIDLPLTLNRIIALSKEKLPFPIAPTDLPASWAQSCDL